MEYAQLNEDDTYSHQITTHGNVQWDEWNYCTADALTRDGKAEQFRIVPLYVTDPPAYDTMTQSVIRDGGQYVMGRWEYKWRIDQLTPEQIAANQAAAQAAFISMVTANTQTRLDDFARTRNYDGILSACTYASSPSPTFAAEGQYCVNQRDATWAALYSLMAQVQAGQRPMPTTWEEVEVLLPVLTWPT